MNLVDRINALQADERAILEKLLSRLEQGRSTYGPWSINDGRNYKEEALEEIVDALHYVAALLVQNGTAGEGKSL